MQSSLYININVVFQYSFWLFHSALLSCSKYVLESPSWGDRFMSDSNTERLCRTIHRAILYSRDDILVTVLEPRILGAYHHRRVLIAKSSWDLGRFPTFNHPPRSWLRKKNAVCHLYIPIQTTFFKFFSDLIDF